MVDPKNCLYVVTVERLVKQSFDVEVYVEDGEPKIETAQDAMTEALGFVADEGDELDWEQWEPEEPHVTKVTVNYGKGRPRTIYRS